MSITWTEGAPGSRSDVSAGAQAIRDLKVAFADGVEPSMYWPGSGGGSAASAGEMRLGTFRTYVAAASAVSVGSDTGRLLVTSDTSRFYAIQPSHQTFMVGGTRVLEAWPSARSSFRWVLSSGTLTPGSVVTFGVTYGGLPVVAFAQPYGVVGNVPIALGVEYLSATTFFASAHTLSGVTWSRFTGGYSDWMSLGTVAL